jgi:hypothetical protein
VTQRPHLRHPPALPLPFNNLRSGVRNAEAALAARKTSKAIPHGRSTAEAIRDQEEAPAQSSSSSSAHCSLISMEQSDMVALDASRNPASNHSTSSYGQILRSSSIIGGATGINSVIHAVTCHSRSPQVAFPP